MRTRWMTVSSIPLTFFMAAICVSAQAEMVVISRDTRLTAINDCVDPGASACSVNASGVLVGQSSDTYAGTGAYNNLVRYGAALASQTSAISSISVSVSESAGAGPPNLVSTGESSFVLRFSLDAPEQYSLSYRFDNHYIGHQQELKLTGPDGQILDDVFDSSNAVSGILNAGLYTLLVDTRAQALGSPSEASTSATLTLAPVPVPDTLVLGASGVLLVGLMIQRRRAQGIAAAATG